MSKPIIKPGAERTRRPKRTVEVSDGVRVVMAGLTQAEKDTIEASFRSPTALLRLPVDYVVNAASGDMYSACVTDDLRLIYQVKPDRVEVVLLLSAGAAEYLSRPNQAEGEGNDPKAKT